MLLTYDVHKRLEHYARPLTDTAPHRSGPPHPADKVFIHTGQHHLGRTEPRIRPAQPPVADGRLPGHQTPVPELDTVAVSAGVAPQTLPLTGQPAGTTGRTVPLAPAGARDPATGIRG